MICFISVKVFFGIVIIIEEEGFIIGLFFNGEDFEKWWKDMFGVKLCEIVLLFEVK